MINKQNLWFAMLFSIILVLSIFYVSMGTDNIDGLLNDEVDVSDSSLVNNESTELVSLRVANEEDVQNTMNELKNTILSDTSTLEEKNDAYDELLVIADTKGVEEKLQSILMKEFDIESFVKISSSGISVVVESDNQDYKDANKIIKRIQQEFNDEKYITVRFN